MTLSNEQRRLRYKNDEAYRNKILNRSKHKYHNDEKYRESKIKSSIKYSKDHPVDKSEYLKKYYIDHKIYMLNTSKRRHDNDRYEVLYWYSDGSMKCNLCNETHYEFLCIDHIDNNGADHRRELGDGGDRIYRYLIKNNFPDGYQVLCNNCNYFKKHLDVKNKLHSNTVYARSMRKQRMNIKLQTLYWYSNGSMLCKCCGEEDIRLLTIDHINGGGKKHVISEGIKNLSEYLYYNNYPEGYRVLCWNCNKSYGQYGYCPHNHI